MAFKDRFESRGVSIVIVSFSELERLNRYQDHHKWPFVILADPKRIAYEAFALKRISWFQVLSPATLKFYWRSRRDGKKREDFGRDDIYQGGGDFLIDRDGNILFAHRSRDPGDRPTAEKVLETTDRIIGVTSPFGT